MWCGYSTLTLDLPSQLINQDETSLSRVMLLALQAKSSLRWKGMELPRLVSGLSEVKTSLEPGNKPERETYFSDSTCTCALCLCVCVCGRGLQLQSGNKTTLRNVTEYEKLAMLSTGSNYISSSGAGELCRSYHKNIIPSLCRTLGSKAAWMWGP